MAAPPPPPPPPPSSSKGGSKKKKQTPAQRAQTSQQTSQAKANIRSKQGNPADPFVTLKNGKVVTTNSAGALHVFGQPVTRSQLLRFWSKYNDLWLNYLGRPISSKELSHFLNLGWSQYQIVTNYLVKRPNFTKSPVWKNRFNDYADVYHQIYGEDAKPDQHAVKYAIVNNLNQAAFADYLRHQPGYQTSQEYKGNFARLATVYQKVYGLPGQQADQIIRQATLGSWSEDQFAMWLRKQPEWKSSDEAKSMYLGLADKFGLLPQTGGQTALGTGPVKSVNPLAGPSPRPTLGEMP